MISFKNHTRTLAVLGLAIAFGMIGTKAHAQLDQDPVYSANATISYGSSFIPSYYGGDGTGGWQFSVSGYTTWTLGDTGDTGTYYSSNWHSSWTPPAPGTYSFSVVNDGDWNYNPSNPSSSYTLTVNKESQASVSSSNATISYGSSFTPSYSGGSGTGGWQFSVQSYTTWDTGTSTNSGTYTSSWSSSWTPPAAGTYTFCVARDGDSNFNSSGSSSSYTLTVSKISQASVSSSNATINFNGTTQTYPAFTPSYSGGSGSGGWQFCVAGYTGWDSGASSNTGTSSGSGGTGTWSSSWTPSSPGTYSFWVVRDGDTDYNTATVAGTYTLTVNGPVDSVQWNSIGLPSTGTLGQTITFSASVTNNGSSLWGSSHYLELQNSSGTDLYDTSISGISPTGSVSPSFTLTLPTSPATYTYTFKALHSGVGYFGTPQTQSIVVYDASLPVITSSLSASGTYNAAFSYAITASHSPTSYGASGLPPGLSVNTSSGGISGTPTSAGTWNATISAINSNGTGSATLAITINAEATTFTASPTTFAYDGSSHSPTITASPSSATFSTSGGSATADGSYSVTATATGNYSGTASFSWTIGPGQPANFALESNAATFVKVAWSASSSSAPSGITYQVYSGSTLVGTTSVTSFIVTGLSAGTSYSYYVVAHDSLGNASAATSTLSGTTPSSTLGTSDAYTLLGTSSSPVDDSSTNYMAFKILNPQ